MAYDVGTTGIKTCIFEIDKDFKILASATESYKLYVYDDGGAEQDPDEWWAAMCSTTRVVLEKSGISPDKIAGVSFCSQAQGLVLGQFIQPLEELSFHKFPGAFHFQLAGLWIIHHRQAADHSA